MCVTVNRTHIYKATTQLCDEQLLSCVMCTNLCVHRCLCDPEDILLIYSDNSTTLPGNLLFTEIYSYVSIELTYSP